MVSLRGFCTTGNWKHHDSGPKSAWKKSFLFPAWGLIAMGCFLSKEGTWLLSVILEVWQVVEKARTPLFTSGTY